MNVVTTLLAKARKVYLSEGPGALLRRGLAFVLGQVFRYERYYLYVNDGSRVRAMEPTGIVPRVGNMTFRVIRSNEEAEDVEAQGL